MPTIKLIYPGIKLDSIVAHINVRKTPNGVLVKDKSPLPNKTIVSVIEEKNNFTKIGKNRYVYSPYLK